MPQSMTRLKSKSSIIDNITRASHLRVKLHQSSSFSIVPVHCSESESHHDILDQVLQTRVLSWPILANTPEHLQKTSTPRRIGSASRLPDANTDHIWSVLISFSCPKVKNIWSLSILDLPFRLETHQAPAHTNIYRLSRHSGALSTGV
jgi:hypothetical protein